MSRDPEPIFDDENPEWTDQDFAEAKPGALLPANVLAAFGGTESTGETAEKISVSLRLSEDVVRHFKSGGSDWERRIDEVLRRAIAR